jgi:protein-S-isoprenylcysteine O-methyltransferase Ste14
MGIAGIGWGVYALKSCDPFGRAAIRAHLSGKPLRPKRFAVNGPNLWVRHPLYFFVILLIWSCPDLTTDRLLFNFLWTSWICIGTILEEKYLVSDFGEDYRQYQDKVPMLIPWKGRVKK